MPGAETNARLLPRGMRWAGLPLSILYGLGVRIHRGVSRARFAPIATICIGNMTVGGTGKTPAVIYIARELARRGCRPAILMRGYKAQGGDEAEEVKIALKGLNVPVLLRSDRYASALKAVELGCDVALLDDGFQHWRLKRDLDVVLIDAMDPFGGGMLPHGKLREPLTGLARAGMIVVTRSDAIKDDVERDALHVELGRLSEFKPVFFSTHSVAGVRALGGDGPVWTLEKLHGTRAVAACGIGNPGAFERTLHTAGVDVLEFLGFDDHHAFTQNEIDALAQSAKMKGAVALVVTEKDAVKIEKLKLPPDMPVLALRVEFKLDNDAEFWNAMMEAVARGDNRKVDAPVQG